MGLICSVPPPSDFAYRSGKSVYFFTCTYSFWLKYSFWPSSRRQRPFKKKGLHHPSPETEKREQKEPGAERHASRPGNVQGAV